MCHNRSAWMTRWPRMWRTSARSWRRWRTRKTSPRSTNFIGKMSDWPEGTSTKLWDKLEWEIQNEESIALKTCNYVQAHDSNIQFLHLYPALIETLNNISKYIFYGFFFVVRAVLLQRCIYEKKKMHFVDYLCVCVFKSSKMETDWLFWKKL